MAFGSSANLTFDILANDRASAKFNNLSRAAKGGVGPLGSFGGKLKSIAKAGALAAGAAVVVAAKFGIDAVEAASDLNEVMSKTQVMFGKSAKAMSKWADGAATAFGQSKTQALEAASNFAIFGKSAGLSGDKLTGFSKKFVGLASDLASFNNTSPEEAIVAIGAAMRGESEPIRKYGVLLDDATLRQQALKMGLIQTTTQALTPQQKVLAASEQIFKQTSAAQGDFARTSEGLANQQRILSAQFTDVKAKLGAQLLPVVVKVANWLTSNFIPASEKVWAFLKSKLGPVFAEVGGWIRSELLPALAQFSNTAGPAVRDTMQSVKDAFKDAKPALKDLGTFITSSLIPAMGILARDVLPVVARQIRLAGKAFSIMGSVIKWTWNNVIQPQFKTFSLAIATMLDLWGTMLGALSHVPGFEWAKAAADKLHRAAEETRGFADALKKIPPRVNTTITTTYVSRQGPGGQGGGGGLGGNPDPASPSKSGRTGGAAGRTTSGRSSSKSDLDGMVLRVVGLDPGMKAYLATGGSGRYS